MGVVLLACVLVGARALTFSSRGSPRASVIRADNDFKNTLGRQGAYDDALLAACDEQANMVVSQQSLSKLENTVTAVLARVADTERKEAGARARREKAAACQQRKLVAAVKRAEADVEAASEAVRVAEEAEKRARPLPDKVAQGLGSMLGQAAGMAADSFVKALDPSIAVAEEAAERARIDAEAAEAAAKAQADEEAKREARRLRKLAPAAEELAVRLVRGLGGGGGGGGSGSISLSASDGEDDDGADRDPRDALRSKLVGSVIYVDTEHVDFRTRWRQTSQGAPKVDERLCGYLATIVSGHYRERAYQSAMRQRVDYAQAYEEMIATYCRLEEGLHAVLPALLRDMEQEETETL